MKEYESTDLQGPTASLQLIVFAEHKHITGTSLALVHSCTSTTWNLSIPLL
jgi:hypothetical protein